ncbi:MAG: autotransporter assembly complex protein TamA [Sphingobium sp.]
MRLRGVTGLTLCAVLVSSGASASAQDKVPEQPQSSDVIIDDQTFDAQLPSLGNDINAPLPSIDSFEAPPENGTTTLPVDAAPAPEPELARPLAPLNSVDVTPVDVAASPDDQKPATVRYSFTVEGLKDIDLEGRFRELSALQSGKGKADTAAMVQARAREDEGLAVRLLHSEGYYDATALSSLDRGQGENAGLNAVLTVTPGKQYKLGEIVVTAQPTTPPDLVRNNLPLKTGDPIISERVEAAEANVALQLPQNGYPFVVVGQRDIALDGATMTGEYTLPVDTGPRSRFRGITTSGKKAFEADHIGVLARFDREDLYDSRKVDDLRRALTATSLFSSVSVEPVRTGEMTSDGAEYVDMQVEQDAGPARTLAGDAGYGTGQGFRAEATWTHRNLFPPEGALILNAVGGTQEQGVGATFRRSNAGRRDRTVQASISASHQDYAAYEAFTATLAGSISRVSTPIFQKRWTWSYGFEVLASNEKTTDLITGDSSRLTYFIGALPGQLGYDLSDDLLNPTRGMRATIRVSPEASLQGNVSPYVRATFDLSGYYPVSDSLVIAARTRLGTISGTSLENVAPSRRIYAGGGGSVRGFGFQELGPKDASNDPIGGRSVNEFAVEARYRFGNFGIVPFVDAGQVYNGSMPKFSDVRFGAGIGGRFYTNFGPFRADVAMPLNRQPGESKIAVYIGIGQAF